MLPTGRPPAQSNRHVTALAVALTCFTASAAFASLPDDGVLRLQLDAALPYRGIKTGDRQQALHVDIERHGGEWSDVAWAYSPVTPAIVHAGRVRRATVTNDAIELQLAFTLDAQMPAAPGGTARYDLTLARDGRYVRGEHHGTVEPISDETALTYLRAQSRIAAPDFTRALIQRDVRGEVAGQYTDPLMTRPPPDHKPPDGPRLLFGFANTKAWLDHGRHEHRADALKQLIAIAGRKTNPRPSVEALAAALVMVHRLTPGDTSKREVLNHLAAVDAGPSPRIVHATELLLETVAWDQARGAVHADVLRVRAMDLRIKALTAATALPSLNHAAEGPYDYYVAAQRSAALLALITLDDQPSLHERRLVQWLRRFLESGIGTHGWPTGQRGFDHAMSFVLPAAAALKRVRGVDITPRTGVPGIALAVCMTDGLAPGGGSPASAWYPLAAHLASPSHRPLLRPASASGDTIACFLRLLTRSHEDVDAEATDHPPLVFADRATRGCVFRSGWDDDDFVTIFTGATRPRPTAQAAGHVVVRGLGRTWLAPPSPSQQPFAWPRRADMNVLQIHKASVNDSGPAVNAAGGRVHDLHAVPAADGRPSGSGSVSITYGDFIETDLRNEASRTRSEAMNDVAKGWRTIGVDYSGRCGAPALMVTIDTLYGTEPRHAAWEINVGDLTSDEVVIDGATFTLKPRGSKATLRGHVLHPETAALAYRPPKDGTSGRLVAWMDKPTAGPKPMLDANLNGQGMPGDPPGAGDPVLDGMKLESRSEREARLRRERQRKRTARLLQEKIFTATTTAKMGAPDRWPRARNTCVVVMTVQAGKPPRVDALDDKQEAMLRVGDQLVTFRPYVILFGEGH